MESRAHFPALITNLPQAVIPLEGVRSYLVQGPDQQMIFMEFDQDVDVAEHHHQAQWGVVLEGQMELTIEGTTSTLRKGECYSIPKGAVHSAKIYAGYKDLTLFDQRDRYECS